MKNPRTLIAVLTVAVGILMIGVLILAMMQQAEVTCEVCVTYHGATRCRTAIGAERSEAIRTATDNACSFLASGMADSISCSNTTPDVATCDD